jgi:hypothetical protein
MSSYVSGPIPCYFWISRFISFWINLFLIISFTTFSQATLLTKNKNIQSAEEIRWQNGCCCGGGLYSSHLCCAGFGMLGLYSARGAGMGELGQNSGQPNCGRERRGWRWWRDTDHVKPLGSSQWSIALEWRVNNPLQLQCSIRWGRLGHCFVQVVACR